MPMPWEDLEAYLPALNGLPNLQVLMTTRVEGHPLARTLHTPALPFATALELFAAHYPGFNPNEEGLLQQLLEAGGL